MTQLTGLLRLGAILSIALYAAALPVSADLIGECGPPAAEHNPLLDQAREANQRLQSSAAPTDRKRQFNDRWTGLSATENELKPPARRIDADCAVLKAATEASLARYATCKAQCDQAANNPAAYQACAACAGPVNAEIAQREAEYNAHVGKIGLYNDRVLAWEGRLKAFIADAEAAIPKGYTGKRFYHMFVKSWINGPEIRESTWAARKIQMDVNVEPRQAMAGEAFDYKIYQSFGVETEFVDGKIVNAVFVPGSKQQLANTTFGLRGEVRVTRDDVAISSDRTRVVFERRIEGNPHMLIRAADLAAAEAVARSWGLDLPATNIKIYSVLRLTVTADGATPDGEGSAFPTHYFWLREKQSDRRFKVQPQVQPSQYFR